MRLRRRRGALISASRRPPNSRSEEHNQNRTNFRLYRRYGKTGSLAATVVTQFTKLKKERAAGEPELTRDDATIQGEPLEFKPSRLAASIVAKVKGKMWHAVLPHETPNEQEFVSCCCHRRPHPDPAKLLRDRVLTRGRFQPSPSFAGGVLTLRESS